MNTKWFSNRILWGVLLVIGGVAFLFQNLGFLELGGIFWAALFGLGGVFFISLYLQNRSGWWALIPGTTLLSIGLLILLGALFPRMADDWGGLIILGGIGVSFAWIYLSDRQNWWAVIPAGVLITLALVSVVESFFPILANGGLFFFGMGLTFAIVALLPQPEANLRWAWFPAGILIIIGVFILAASEDLINYIWPAVLILAGGFLVLRTVTRK